MATYRIEESTLVRIADSIRNAAGKTSDIKVSDIAAEIKAIGENGVTLPELTNEGSASDLLLGKQLIDSKGSKVTGTFTIDSELTTQDDLIAQISSALEGKAAGSIPVLQEKTITPSTSSQNVTPDSGYDGLSKVTVNAMPTATQATPSISVNSSGLITASATQSAGYVSAGTKSATKQLTTQAAKTITPSTSSQTAVASGRYTTGTVTVAAIPSSYVQPSGTLSVTSNGIYNVKDYASVNVNVANSGGSSSSLPAVDVGIVESSAEGSVVYSYLDIDESIHTVISDLTPTFFQGYSCILGAVLLNSPITVLTSGTITMPIVEEYTLETIASGTGYAVYQYTASGTSEPEEGEIPDIP